MAQDLNMKSGMKVEITKCHHFVELEQHRAKDMSLKLEKLNFGKKMLKIGLTPKRLNLDIF